MRSVAVDASHHGVCGTQAGGGGPHGHVRRHDHLGSHRGPRSGGLGAAQVRWDVRDAPGLPAAGDRRRRAGPTPPPPLSLACHLTSSAAEVMSSSLKLLPLLLLLRCVCPEAAERGRGRGGAADLPLHCQHTQRPLLYAPYLPTPRPLSPISSQAVGVDVKRSVCRHGAWLRAVQPACAPRGRRPRRAIQRDRLQPPPRRALTQRPH